MMVGDIEVHFHFSYSSLTSCPICLCFLHVLVGVCTYTHHPDRLYQQPSAGLYLEWHLEG